MDAGGLAKLIGIDVLVIIVMALVVGLPAPRWPRSWLVEDHGPLHLTRVDKVEFYRDLRVSTLIRVLPEGGSWAGGDSKSSLPGTDTDSLVSYLIEVRRAEWVHTLMAFAWVPLIFFNPMWLWMFFAAGVIFINLMFWLVLRYNRVRIVRILDKRAA